MKNLFKILIVVIIGLILLSVWYFNRKPESYLIGVWRDGDTSMIFNDDGSHVIIRQGTSSQNKMNWKINENILLIESEGNGNWTIEYEIKNSTLFYYVIDGKKLPNPQKFKKQ